MYKDFPRLPERAREALRNFLIRLQANPRDTSIYRDAQRDLNEYYAFSFYEGWVVYWHLDVDENAATILHHGVRYIEVLAIRSLS